MSQTKSQSFAESCSGALVAAPTAIILHIVLLTFAGDFAIGEHTRAFFATISWVIFLFHSIIWRYITRRIYDMYQIDLNPVHLIRRAIK